MMLTLDEPRLSLRAVGLVPARALLAQTDGALYIGRRNLIYCSGDEGITWTHVGSLPQTLAERAAAVSRLGCRLLRHEVRAMAILSDGSIVAANRAGIYHASRDEKDMRASNVLGAGDRWSPPMTIAVGAQDAVLWGEYNSSYQHKLPIRLFASSDRGQSYHVVHLFEPGCILHVHNVMFDKTAGHYWVFTGDFGEEAGIGRLSIDLKTFEWVARGNQCFRLVEALDFGDHLVYGTDSPLERNAVVRFHKSTGRIERLVELDGSCIYACRFGRWCALSTTVEPSGVNQSPLASLWVSSDGDRWHKLLSVKKDRWHPVYFQFGSIVLPRGASGKETLLLSGQALEGFDGRAFVGTLRES